LAEEQNAWNLLNKLIRFHPVSIETTRNTGFLQLSCRLTVNKLCQMQLNHSRCQINLYATIGKKRALFHFY